MVSCTIGKVQNDRLAGTLEKARVLGALGGVALKALEAADAKSPGGGQRALEQLPTEQTAPPGWSKEALKKKLKSLSMAELEVLHGILGKFRAIDQAEG